ncbi:substrate-binding domain-containing protein [Saccharopolyspora sp. NPDC000359]|uniref:PstS family phosphate ABC transporter substrate-binding protein n=1 Tax=Saccharopolyspora sp. NPDC000359 TaxID=3154251 RepID=UPI0033246E99
MTEGTGAAARRRALRHTITLVCVLAMAPLAPAAVLANRITDRLTCADGELTVIGSAVYAPVLRKAAEDYAATCPDSRIRIEAGESAGGLQRLVAEAEADRGQDGAHPELLAISDGPRGHELPHLREKLFASAVFTFVVNPAAGVTDLSRQQIRDIYGGRITSWAQVGGNDVPIAVADLGDSSAQRILRYRVLGEPEAACETGAACGPQVGRDSLRSVAETPGGFGFAVVGAADHPGVRPVRIDGEPAPEEATTIGRYPFRQAGYGYTYDDARAGSLATGFLSYLVNNPNDR